MCLSDGTYNIAFFPILGTDREWRAHTELVDTWTGDETKGSTTSDQYTRLPRTTVGGTNNPSGGTISTRGPAPVCVELLTFLIAICETTSVAIT